MIDNRSVLTAEICAYSKICRTNLGLTKSELLKVIIFVKIVTHAIISAHMMALLSRSYVPTHLLANHVHTLVLTLKDHN